MMLALVIHLIYNSTSTSTSVGTSNLLNSLRVFDFGCISAIGIARELHRMPWCPHKVSVKSVKYVDVYYDHSCHINDFCSALAVGAICTLVQL